MWGAGFGDAFSGVPLLETLGTGVLAGLLLAAAAALDPAALLGFGLAFAEGRFFANSSSVA